MKIDDGFTVARLADALDAYGGDFRRWPDGLRAPAEALVARDAEARRLHEAALALDALLDAAPAPLPSRELKARIVRRAAPPLWRQGLAALWPFGPAWQPAAALLLIAAIGVAIGPYLGSDELAAREIDVLALGSFDDEISLSADDGEAGS
ncbi:MAG: hypothetical protein AB7P52_11970 [Alphaproteobacteria bacterium]